MLTIYYTLSTSTSTAAASHCSSCFTLLIITTVAFSNGTGGIAKDKGLQGSGNSATIKESTVFTTLKYLNSTIISMATKLVLIMGKMNLKANLKLWH